MVRPLEKRDIEQVMEIWLKGNLEAHGFVPEAYWKEHEVEVKAQLLDPEIRVYVWEAQGKVEGFAGMAGCYLAGIFVDGDSRSKGIGKGLTDFLKEQYPEITLQVYCKNRGGIAFYLREGFWIASHSIDEDTKEEEYTMEWRKARNLKKLRDYPQLTEQAALWFSQKWGIPADAYRESIKESLEKKDGYPQWYGVFNEKDEMIAGCGVIENDFHDRKDLFPNLCALFVEEPWRRQGIARWLLDFVRWDIGKKGIKKLYLVTDHTEFYEKCGWTFLTMVKDQEGIPERMYEADTL